MFYRSDQINVAVLAGEKQKKKSGRSPGAEESAEIESLIIGDLLMANRRTMPLLELATLLR